jgi:multidrug resistance efflux pump
MASFIRVGVPACFAAFMWLGAALVAGEEPVEPEGETVINLVEGRTRIMTVKPGGSLVRRGELVCELDSTRLKTKLADQIIVTKSAEIASRKAERDRRVAEVAVAEYVEGTFKQEIRTIQGEIALAEAELKRAEDRLKWSNRMQGQYGSERLNLSVKLSRDQKLFALEQAKTRMVVLEKYTKDKTVKELQGEVEKARLEETARETAYERELEAEAWLKVQVENCKVVAPVSGRVRLFRTVEEGATVRERQLLFRIIPEEEPEVLLE